MLKKTPPLHKKFLKKPGKQKVGLPVAPTVGGGKIKIKLGQEYLWVCALKKIPKGVRRQEKERRRPPRIKGGNYLCGWGVGVYNICKNIIKKKECVFFFVSIRLALRILIKKNILVMVWDCFFILVLLLVAGL